MIVAANRDEFYARPTQPASRWEDSEILAGKDLQAGGTWLGVHPQGRWSALTNYRDPVREQQRSLSRGKLVLDYLESTGSPDQYLAQVHQERDQYNGYNLLTGNEHDLYYYSNVAGEIKQLEPGLYGLSNHLLDTPWPKVERGKSLFHEAIQQDELDVERLFQLLTDTVKPADDALPNTGVPLAWERLLSPMFIQAEGYGTRCSTVLTIDYAGRVEFYERTYPVDLGDPVTRHDTLIHQPI